MMIMKENIDGAIEQFKSLAEERLNNHLLELNTRYGGEKPENDLIRQGYEDHRRIFEQELELKQQELAGSENPWLASEIEKIKQSYLHRLVRTGSIR
jgi:hypothetical protein